MRKKMFVWPNLQVTDLILDFLSVHCVCVCLPFVFKSICIVLPLFGDKTNLLFPPAQFECVCVCVSACMYQ